MKTSQPRQPSGRERLSTVLRRAGALVSIDDAATALHIGRSATSKVLARWERQGWVTRVRRGLYAPVPLTSSSDDHVVEDPWILVPKLFDPAYVSGASAAHHWDLTEQLFRSVFVLTAQPVRHKNRTVHGTSFVLRHIEEDKLFGTRALWRGSVRIQVADVHRTIIDLLDDPASGGGIRHIEGCLQAYLKRSDASPDILLQYGNRLGNGAVFKRLGFLAERLGAPQALVTGCAGLLTKGNAMLDPELPCPRLLRRWRLWIPEHWKRSAIDD